MILTKQLVVKIRELGYVFDEQTGRVDIYKKPGSASRLTINRRNNQSRMFCGTILRNAGLPDENIRKWLDETDAK